MGTKSKRNSAAKHRVGRGNTPIETRYKKGQSGNPKGRPKGSRNLATSLSHELSKKIVVREDGVAQKISKKDALLKSMIAKGLQGDLKASQAVVNMMERHAAKEPPEPDMSVDINDIELLRRYMPYLVELLNRNGGEDDNHQSN